MAVKPSYIAMFICSLGGKKQLTLSRLENGLHELVGDFRRERRIGVGEGVFPQRDCSFVAGEVLLAVRANAKVTIEAGADVGRKFAGQVVSHEICKLATSHKPNLWV
jgi:hypothetical protein